MSDYINRQTKAEEYFSRTPKTGSWRNTPPENQVKADEYFSRTPNTGDVPWNKIAPQSASDIIEKPSEQMSESELAFAEYLKNSTDPDLELMKIQNSRWIADRYDISPEEAYANYDAYSEALWKTRDVRTGFQQFIDSAKLGWASAELNQLAKNLMNSPNGVNQEAMDRIEEIRKTMPEPVSTRGFWYGPSVAAESIASMTRTFLDGSAEGLKKLNEFATSGIQAVKDNGANLFMDLWLGYFSDNWRKTSQPETVAVRDTLSFIDTVDMLSKVSAAGNEITSDTMKAVNAPSLLSGVTEFSEAIASPFVARMNDYQGSFYLNLREQGVKHDVAKPVANVIGAITYGIEAAQVAETFFGGIGGKLAGPIVANVIVSKPFLGLVAKAGIGLVGKGVVEGVEESLQALSEIVGEQVAKSISKANGNATTIKGETLGSIASRVGQSFYGGAAAAMVMGFLPSVAGLGGDVKAYSDLRNQAETGKMTVSKLGEKVELDYTKQKDPKADFIAANMNSQVFTDSVKDDARKKYLGQVWDELSKKRATESKAKVETVVQEGEKASTEETPGEPEPIKRSADVVTSEMIEAIKKGDLQKFSELSKEDVAEDVEPEAVAETEETPAWMMTPEEFEQAKPKGVEVEETVDTRVTEEAGVEPSPVEVVSSAPEIPKGASFGLEEDVISQIRTAAPQLDDESVSAFDAYVSVVANARGMSPTEYWKRNIAGIKAADETSAEWVKNTASVTPIIDTVGKRVSGIIEVAKKGNTRALVEEVFHIESLNAKEGFDSILTKDDWSTLETWARENKDHRLYDRVRTGQWTEEQFILELAADANEKYLRGAKVENSKIKAIFDKIVDFLNALYKKLSSTAKAISGELRLSPEIKAVFDRAYQTKGTPLSEAADRGAFAYRSEATMKEQIRGLSRENLEEYYVKAQTAHLTDALTGIPNKAAYMSDETRNGGPLPVQVAIDLDGFKWINDNAGHRAGDNVLIATAAILKEVKGDSQDFDVYRTGGDEFTIAGTSVEAINAAMVEISKKMADTVIEYQLNDGTAAEQSGILFSWGLDETGSRDKADVKAAEDKKRNEGIKGQRGKSDLPGNVRRITPAERKGNDDQKAGVEGEPTEASPGPLEANAKLETPVSEEDEAALKEYVKDVNAKRRELIKKEEMGLEQAKKRDDLEARIDFEERIEDYTNQIKDAARAVAAFISGSRTFGSSIRYSVISIAPSEAGWTVTELTKKGMTLSKKEVATDELMKMLAGTENLAPQYARPIRAEAKHEVLYSERGNDLAADEQYHRQSKTPFSEQDILSIRAHFDKIIQDRRSRISDEEMPESMRAMFQKKIAALSRISDGLSRGYRKFISESGKEVALVHPSTRNGIKYQVSFYDHKGAFTHVDANSPVAVADALADAPFYYPGAMLSLPIETHIKLGEILYHEGEEVSEHELAVMYAVEKRLPVPSNILDYYSTIEWAEDELNKRAEYKKEVDGFETAEDYAGFHSSMDQDGDGTYEYYRMLFNEVLADRDKANGPGETEAERILSEFSTKYAKQETLELLLKEAREKDLLGLFDDHQFVSAALSLRKTGKSLKVPTYKSLYSKMMNRPRKYLGIEFEIVHGIDPRHDRMDSATANAVARDKAELDRILKDDTVGDEIEALKNEVLGAKKEARHANKKYADLVEKKKLTEAWLSSKYEEVEKLQKKMDALIKEEQENDSVLVSVGTKWEKVSTQLSDLKKKIAEEKIKAREMRREIVARDKLARRIFYPVNLKRIDIEAFKYVRGIQEGFIKSGSKKAVERHVMVRQAFSDLIASLEADPTEENTAQVKEIKASKAYKDAQKRYLAELDLDELSAIAEEVVTAVKNGRKRLKLKKEERENHLAGMRANIEKTLAGTKAAQKAEYYFHGTEEYKRQISHFKRIGTWDAAMMNAKRFFRVLDGDQDKGPNVAFAVEYERDQYKAEMKQTERRNSLVIDRMKELNITGKDLSEKVKVEGIGTLTKSQLLGLYIAMQDEQSQEAVIFGNFAPEDKRLFDEDTLVEYGNSILRIVNRAIDKNLSPEMKALADVFAEDWAETGHRLAAHQAEVHNELFSIVGNYFPMWRQNVTGTDFDLANDLGTRTRLQNGPRKHFTKDRLTISPLHQTPIELDVMKVWQGSMKQQEHYLAYDEYVRDLNAIYTGPKTKEMRATIRRAFGKEAEAYLSEYISTVAEPSLFETRQALAKVVKYMRGSIGVAALAYNVKSMARQWVTSPWPYLPYAGPQYLASALECAAHPLKKLRFAEENSAVIKHRTFNLAQQAAMGRKVNAWTRFGNFGFKGMEWADKTAVVIGWNACYEKETRKLTKTGQYTPEDIHERACAYADDITLLCQPSGREVDLAPMFRHSNSLVQPFIQFGVSLSTIYQQLRYDMPNEFKKGHPGKAMMILFAYGAAGLCQAAVVQMIDDLYGRESYEGLGGKDDDEETRLKKFLLALTSQGLQADPLIGDHIYALTRGLFLSEKPWQFPDELYPFIGELYPLVGGLIDQDIDKVVTSAITSAGWLLGGPVKGVRDIQTLIKRATE